MTSPDRDRVLVSRADLEALFKGFDEGVFVRGTDRDHESGWAIRCLRPVAGLAGLLRALHGDVPTGGDANGEPTREQPPALSTHRSAPAAGGFVCVARAAGLTDPPQDCDWPFCGCDVAATRVLQVLQEMGWGPPSPVALAAPSALEAFEGTHDAAAREAIDAPLGRESAP